MIYFWSQAGFAPPRLPGLTLGLTAKQILAVRP